MADSRVDSIVATESNRAKAAEAELGSRISALEAIPVYASNKDDATLNQNLANIVDNAGNLLGYFDKKGDLHINGNIYANNI